MPTPGPRTAMRRSDRAIEVMVRRTAWILRGLARLAQATGRGRTAPASANSKVRRRGISTQPASSANIEIFTASQLPVIAEVGAAYCSDS